MNLSYRGYPRVYNFLGINPISALFWMAVINGFLAPPLLLVIMLIANNRSVMGSKINGLGLNVLGGRRRC